MTHIMCDWPEILASIFLSIGIIFGIFSKNLAAVYIICILAGLLFGRLWWKFKKDNKTPIFISIMTFFFGFILGTLFADIRIILILLLLGTLAGYWLHEKKIITSVGI